MRDRRTTTPRVRASARPLAEFHRLGAQEAGRARSTGRLARRISATFDRAFYPSGARHRRWKVAEVQATLSRADLAILIRSPGRRGDAAYAVFSRGEAGGQGVLFVDSMGVVGPRAEGQGRGLGRWLVAQALRQYPSEIVAARTQNPAFVRMLQSLRPGELLPGPNGYGATDRGLLRSIVRRFGGEWADRVDLETGVCRQAYGRTRLGEYTVDRSEPTIARIEARLRGLDRGRGFDRDGGDAVVVVAKWLRSGPRGRRSTGAREAAPRDPPPSPRRGTFGPPRRPARRRA